MAYRIKGKFVSKQAYEAWKAEQDFVPLNVLIQHTLASEQVAVSAMVERINVALKERGDFERKKSPNGSHIELRKVENEFSDSRTAAAFFVINDVDPDLVFNRVRKDGWRSNLKGLHKVRKLIDYCSGKTKVLERVSLALFASTIIAANKGITWVASPEQELILSAEQVGSFPPELREAIRGYQHKFMRLTGDSRPQACEFRTTFANLGLYEFYRDEFDNYDYTLGVSVNMDSPVIRHLSTQWGLV